MSYEKTGKYHFTSARIVESAAPVRLLVWRLFSSMLLWTQGILWVQSSGNGAQENVCFTSVRLRGWYWADGGRQNKTFYARLSRNFDPRTNWNSVVGIIIFQRSIHQHPTGARHYSLVVAVLQLEFRSLQGQHKAP